MEVIENKNSLCNESISLKIGEGFQEKIIDLSLIKYADGEVLFILFEFDCGQKICLIQKGISHAYDGARVEEKIYENIEQAKAKIEREKNIAEESCENA